MSNNQPKTFCPLLQPLQSENKTHPLPSPGVKKVWIPSQMLDLQDVPKSVLEQEEEEEELSVTLRWLRQS